MHLQAALQCRGMEQSDLVSHCAAFGFRSEGCYARGGPSPPDHCLPDCPHTTRPAAASLFPLEHRRGVQAMQDTCCLQRGGGEGKSEVPQL